MLSAPRAATRLIQRTAVPMLFARRSFSAPPKKPEAKPAAKEAPPAAPASAAPADDSGAGGGSSPISMGDLYELYYLSEPSQRVSARTAQGLFENDQKIHEVVVYMNGGMHTPQDKLSEDFIRHMFNSHVWFFVRDAGPARKKPFNDFLKTKGSADLPQVWVRGKMTAAGPSLGDKDKVADATKEARRPWPRQGTTYQEGFTGAEGQQLVQ